MQQFISIVIKQNFGYLPMKKILLILFILNTSFLFAQKGAFFRFEGGYALPLVDLSSQKWDTTSVTGGFAKAGYNYGIDIAYFFRHNMGLSFSFVRHIHTLNNEAIYYKAFEPGIDSILTVESNPWVLNYLLLGFSQHIYSGERLTVEANLKAGRMTTFAPKIKLLVFDMNGVPATYERKPAYAATISFGGGLGFKYSLNEVIKFSFFANYLHSMPEFFYKENSIKVKNNLGVLNATFGLSYSIF